jgi:hypothetical protein
LTVTLPLPFRHSRPLAKGEVSPTEAAVALEVVGIDLEEPIYDGWRRRVERAARFLGWPPPRFSGASADAGATTLWFTAPANQLQTAREANEWALCASVLDRDPSHWSSLRDSLRAAVLAAVAADPERTCITAEIEEAAALQRLAGLAMAEAQAAGHST